MKIILKLSILLNLLLAGGLVFVAINQRKEPSLPAREETKAPGPVAEAPVPPQVDDQPQPFRWRQLDSGNDYRLFIANLRAAGCPENTIEDIVRGNVGRAFAWEHHLQRVDDSSNGPWSRFSELQLVDNLLGKTSAASSGLSPHNTSNQGIPNTVAAQDASSMAQPDGNGEAAANSAPPQHDSVLVAWRWRGSQSMNDSAAMSGDGQQASISKAQISSSSSDGNGTAPNINDPSSQNGSASDSPGTAQSAGADNSSPDDGTVPQLPDTSDPNALSGPEREIIDQERYSEWFKDQVMANAGGGPLNVDPTHAPQ